MHSAAIRKSVAIALPAIAALALAVPAAAKDRILSDIPDAGLPKSYAWAPMVAPQTKEEADPRVVNSIIQNRIIASVDSALTAKGYVRSDQPDNADMLVAYRVGLRDKTRTDVDTWGSPYPFGAFGCRFASCFYGGYGWGPWGPPDTTVTQFDYTEGQLMVDLVSRHEPQQLLWRVTHSETITSKDSKAEEIDKMVKKMLKKLPPPGTSE